MELNETHKGSSLLWRTVEDRSIIQTQWDENSGLGNTGSQLPPVIIHQMLLILPPQHSLKPVVFAPHSKYLSSSSLSTWLRSCFLTGLLVPVSHATSLVSLKSFSHPAARKTHSKQNTSSCNFLVYNILSPIVFNTPEGHNMLPPEERGCGDWWRGGWPSS